MEMIDTCGGGNITQLYVLYMGNCSKEQEKGIGAGQEPCFQLAFGVMGRR